MVMKLPEEAMTASLDLRLRILKNTAKRRKISWQLSDYVACQFLFSNCFYCGLPPSASFSRYKNRDGTLTQSGRQSSAMAVNNGTIYTNGIDRIDNSLGYLQSNCVACCWACNLAKGDRTPKEFKEWLIRIFNHQTFVS